MKDRCNSKANKNYDKYGGRGITICQEWLNDFMNFYSWSINNGYEETLTIDRIDNNGHYEPSNCRWVDMKTQANNRSNNSYIEYNNKKYTYSEFESAFNVPQKNLRKLIKNLSIEDILKMYTYFKCSDLCNKLNISKNRLKNIIKSMNISPDFISNNGWFYFSETTFNRIKKEVNTVIY